MADATAFSFIPRNRYCFWFQ